MADLDANANADDDDDEGTASPVGEGRVAHEPTTVDVRAERMVAGGLALCRDPDGRIVLAAGALPGERVVVAARAKRGTAQGAVVEVLEPSPDRVEPTCPAVALGCGGCDWQHVAVDRQPALRAEVVADVLRRIGRLPDPVVRTGPPVAPEGTRNSLRLAVDAHRMGLRAEASHDVIPLDDCLVAHPALAALLEPGVVEPGKATEITLRVALDADGAVTARLLVASPTAEGVTAPEDVVVVGEDELDAGHRTWFHTHLGGADLRVSARSFLQGRNAGADALVAVVREQLEGAPPGAFADLYGGIGLFAATCAGDRPIVLVERSKSACADARVNLADCGGPDHDVRVIAQPVERWRPSPAAVVVADPARSGLGRAGVEKAAATGADRIVLVSCDAGALGRDTAMLVASGYRHVESVVVDLFGHTGHVEVVTRFDAADR